MSWADLAQSITQDQQETLIEQALQSLQGLPLATIRDRAKLTAQASSAISLAATRLGLVVPTALNAALVQQLVARTGGLGFLNDLLPPARNDLSEIALNPDGTLWLMKKGARGFEKLDQHPPLDEVWRSVEALLAPMGRALSEATPTVDAKLPRSEGMGGARIKVIHPNIAPGKGYPSINIRLFEARPVRPERLVEWKVAPEAVIQSLLEHVGRGLRIFVIGGTGTGKTTLLSALCSGIPKQARVVKIEDPEEIWLDHPNVVTLEARPSQPGSNVTPYTLTDGVNDAMRMSPTWLIMGEVRTGERVLAIEETPTEVVISTGQQTVRCEVLVVCGGLQADRLAECSRQGLFVVGPLNGVHLRRIDVEHVINALLQRGRLVDDRHRLAQLALEGFARRIDGRAERNTPRDDGHAAIVQRPRTRSGDLRDDAPGCLDNGPSIDRVAHAHQRTVVVWRRTTTIWCTSNGRATAAPARVATVTIRALT